MDGDRPHESVPEWYGESGDVPLSEYGDDYQRVDDEGDVVPNDFFSQQYVGENLSSEDDDGPASPDLDIAVITETLNDEQYEAVTMEPDAGPTLVLAGAGTGKTAVLIRRIAYLVARGVSPTSILAVTFTNKAAREMRERLERYGISPMPMMGTFHSIGLAVVRLCPASAGVRHGFTIMDEQDTVSLWKRLFIVKPGAVQGRLQFLPGDDKAGRYCDALFRLKEVGVRHASDIPDFLEYIGDRDHGRDPYIASIAPVVGEMLDIYERERESMNLVDFSDLISASKLAICEHERGQRWAGRFTHMLVDEFQDTSRLQFEWIQSIFGKESPEQQNLFCVGDDNQSIYSFRGAVIENIDTFARNYRARIIKLEHNYRCGTDILDAANRLISNNPNGSRKNLWADGAAGSIGMGTFRRDTDESDWIAQDVRGHEKSAAVLLRTRAAMIPILQSLRRDAVVYHVVGAADFFSSREIRDAISLMRLAANPCDNTAFSRAALLFDGVGKTAVDSVIASVSGTGMSALAATGSHKSARVRAIGTAFEGIDGNTDAHKALTDLCRRSGLTEACESDPERRRIDNLREMHDICERFGTVSEFLEEMTLFAEKRENGEGVTVSTIHAAKGLEWDRVYLPALSEGHIPSVARAVLDANGCDHRTDREKRRALAAIEEERRLMYVAITRTRDTLNLSWAKTRMVHGKVIECEPSRFIDEAGLGDRPRRGAAMRN